jgi:hypothetical protein
MHGGAMGYPAMLQHAGAPRPIMPLRRFVDLTSAYTSGVAMPDTHKAYDSGIPGAMTTTSAAALVSSG